MGISRRMPVSRDKRFRRTRVTLTDIGPMERWQHDLRVLVVMNEGDGSSQDTRPSRRVAATVAAPHILDALYHNGRLSDCARQAGHRFQEDFFYAGLSPHVSGGYSALRLGHDIYRMHERSDRQEAAYQRWRKAIVAMGGGYADVVITTVCYEQAPSMVVFDRLKEGLERLAIYYGLKKRQ